MFKPPASNKVIDKPLALCDKEDVVILPKAVLIDIERAIGYANSTLAGLQRKLQGMKK